MIKLYSSIYTARMTNADTTHKPHCHWHWSLFWAVYGGCCRFLPSRRPALQTRAAYTVRPFFHLQASSHTIQLHCICIKPQRPLHQFLKLFICCLKLIIQHLKDAFS